jgi:hypothetical protein
MILCKREPDLLGDDLDRILEPGQKPVSDPVIVSPENEAIVASKIQNGFIETVRDLGPLFLDNRRE